MKAVILAAGEGRRLRPLTHRRPKPMLPVANKPVLEYVIEAVATAGIEEIVLVVGYKRDRIQTYFGDGDDWGVSIEYVIQSDQLGTGHALLQAAERLDGDFLVLNGDRIIDAELVSDVAGSPGAGSAIAVTRVGTAANYGVVTAMDERLVGIEEKPVTHPESGVINAGVYRLTPAIFGELETTDRAPDGELRLPDALTQMAEKTPIDVIRYRGRWTDVTYLWDLLSVTDAVLSEGHGEDRGTIHRTAVVNGHTAIGRDATVAANATVQRGTAIGPNASIGANAVLDSSVVMRDAQIGAGAVIRDCIVAENAVVGPNTTVAGGHSQVVVADEVHDDVRLGAVIGDNARLGGSVVCRPGTIVGDDVTVVDGASLDGWIDRGVRVERG